MKIIVVGSSNTDMIFKVPRIPKPGETLLGGVFLTAAGGKGANQAVAAARAGGNVTFIARVGQDMFGEQALAGFRADGIDVRNCIQDAEAPSGVAGIFVADDGENSIAVAPGANARLSPADIDAAADVFQGADILLLQLEIPLTTVTSAAELAHQNGTTVILNPAPACALSDRLSNSVDVITPNETEAALLTGIEVTDDESAAKAAAVLRNKGIATVIITMGAAGVFISSAVGEKSIKGFRVTTVDTTAAGDVFNGAFAVALAEGQLLEESVRFAQAAAALSVTRLGAQPSAPTREEISAFFSRQIPLN
jgi:ribokinase